LKREPHRNLTLTQITQLLPEPQDTEKPPLSRELLKNVSKLPSPLLQAREEPRYTATKAMGRLMILASISNITAAAVGKLTTIILKVSALYRVIQAADGLTRNSGLFQNLKIFRSINIFF